MRSPLGHTAPVTNPKDGEWLLLMRRKRRELETEIGRHQKRLDNIIKKAVDRKKLVITRKDKAKKKQ